MRAMILVLLFLISLPGLGLAEVLPDRGSRAAQNDVPAPPEGFVIERPATGIDGTAELSDAEVFGDLPNAPAVSDKTPKRGEIGGIIGQIMTNPNNDTRTPACKKSKTEMEEYENCWLQFIRDMHLRQHPSDSDLVELLISKLRLAEKKRITGKISKEEADVLRAEAHVQFQNGIASRANIVRQEEQGRDDQERQLRILDRDIKRSERDSQLRESEYQTERLRRELEAQERERERFDRTLRDMTRGTTRSPTSLPTQTDCYTAAGAIHCYTR